MVVEAKRRYPQEACGLIVGAHKRARFIPCENIHERPRDFFSIGRGEYEAAKLDGPILAVWHSHTECAARPSPEDRAACNAGSVPWYIVSVYRQEDGSLNVVLPPTIVQPRDEEQPYVGRPYVWGMLDCYALICDYYRREYAIELLTHGDLRIPEFWEKGHNFFVDNFSETGFEQLINVEPKPGDIFLIQTYGSIPNHIGVYVGNDRFLHHPHGRLSRFDVYGGSYWLKHTTHHLRHRELM